MVKENRGELLTEQYLIRRELRYVYEDRVGTREPDFSVELPDGRTAVLEVMEPQFRLPDGFRAGAIDPYQVVRRALDDTRKRKQAQAVAEAGRPFMLVLSAEGSAIGFDEHNIPGAMFGNVGITIPVGPDITDELRDEDTSVVFGSGGRVQPERRRSFSAVAVVSAFNPTLVVFEHEVALRFGGVDRSDRAAVTTVIYDTHEELVASGALDLDAEAPRLRVFHNPFAVHPLDLNAFGGPHDDQWSVADDDGGYGWVTGGAEGRYVPGR